MPEFTYHIQSTSPLREVKEEFRRAFPFLKLEFFRKGHHHGEGSPIHELLSDQITVAEARAGGHDGMLKVADNMTVEDLEDVFDQSFGLHVQVFRRSGKIWLETSVTDKWSLERQNAHGAESTEQLT